MKLNQEDEISTLLFNAERKKSQLRRDLSFYFEARRVERCLVTPLLLVCAPDLRE